MNKVTAWLICVMLLIASCTSEDCQLSGVVYLTDGDKLDGCYLSGMVVIEGQGVTVENMVIDATGYEAGVYIKPGSSDVLVKNVEAFGGSRFGIGSLSWPEKSIDNVRIENCNAHDNLGDSTYLENWSGSGIVLEGVTNSIIYNSRAYRNGRLSNSQYKNGPVGIWLANAENSKIIGCNSFYNETREGHKDGGGFDLDGGCVNCSIERCISFGNAGPGFLIWHWKGSSETRNLTIRDCKSENDQFGLQVGTGGEQVTGVRIERCSLIGRTAYRVDQGDSITISNSYLCGRERGPAVLKNNEICKTES